MQDKIKRSAIIFALILLCLTGLFDTLYQASPLPAFEENSTEYLSELRNRAAYSYAAARALNATISLIESVDTGIGIISIQPGQFLEPINDMIEQFSDLVLIALASIGAQEILIRLMGDISWSFLLPLALLPGLIAPWLPSWQHRLSRLSAILVFGVVFSRILIPSIALSGQYIADNYLKPDYQKAIHQVEETRKATYKAVGAKQVVSQELPPQITDSAKSSTFSKSPDATGETVLLPDFDTVKSLYKTDRIFSLFDNLPDKIITLLTILAFETLLWPLMVTFLLLWLGRTFLRSLQ